MSQEVGFPLGARREVGVTPFAGERPMAVTVPIQAGFAETGSSRNDGRVAGGFERTIVEDREVFLVECRESVRIGLEVVDQPDRVQAQVARQLGGIDQPGQIGRLDASTDDRPGDSKTGHGGAGVLSRQEMTDGGVERLIVAAG